MVTLRIKGVHLYGPTPEQGDRSGRASLYFYNTHEEIDQFVAALESTIAFFRDMGTV